MIKTRLLALAFGFFCSCFVVSAGGDAKKDAPPAKAANPSADASKSNGSAKAQAPAKTDAKPAPKTDAQPKSKSDASSPPKVDAKPATNDAKVTAKEGKGGPKVARKGKDAKKDDGSMLHTKLMPSHLFKDLCLLKYRVSTTSPEAQAYVDQGLGFYYSYVWMEAARSFETATQKDPNCALAWWGLSKSIEKWGKGQHAKALEKAKELLPLANPREAFLIRARLQEKGMLDNLKPEDRKKAASKTLDEMITLFEDDEEAWMCRGLLDAGTNAAVPYYKAVLRINPDHPGAHHELVHHYENIRRPAIGWAHAEGYMRSSPGIPHAFHMQAHLAMRIGKWRSTTDWSSRAIVMEETYHKSLKVKPNEDWQYSHHLETLMKSLTHDGRFAEARAIKKRCEEVKYYHDYPWFRLHMAERKWDDALKIVADRVKKDKVRASYLRAVVYLGQGNPARALPEVQTLEEAFLNKRGDKELEHKLWETKGFLLALTGEADAGLKLMAKTVNRTKDNYLHHSWGQGAYYMEQWGLAALRAGKLDVAEEAFLEALAHDAGSVRGAVGMRIVCERLGRTEEAVRFEELSRRCWRKADPGALDAEYSYLKGAASPQVTRVGAE